MSERELLNIFKSLRREEHGRIRRVVGGYLNEETSIKRGKAMTESGRWIDEFYQSESRLTEKNHEKRRLLDDDRRRRIRSGELTLEEAIDIDNYVEETLGIKEERRRFIGNCLPWEY